jgi:hypothetical protein
VSEDGSSAEGISPSDGLVPPPQDPVLRELAAALAEHGGGFAGAILLYGSHLQASRPDRWSAYDFIVVVDAYGPFYRSLFGKGLLRRAPRVLTILSYLLPPNVIAFNPGRSDGAIAKCAVYRPAHFRRSLGRHASDHFLKGRVAQRVALVWRRDPSDEAAAALALQKAREDIPRWVRPYLSGPFGVERFAETMLRVSYAAEIRPERPDRVYQVFNSQKEALVEVARASLRSASQAGAVIEDGGAYRWVHPPGKGARLRSSAYFTWSKVRATARWAKYVFTFDDWLDYILRKVERRGGFKVEVKKSERRWPLLLLWPKVFRVLRSVRRTGSEARSNGEKP